MLYNHSALNGEVKSMLYKTLKNTKLGEITGTSSIDWKFLKLQHEVSTQNYVLSDDYNIFHFIQRFDSKIL